MSIRTWRAATALAIVAATAGVADRADADNVLVNPGFETGDFSGWDTFSCCPSDGSLFFVSGNTPHSGSFVAEFDGPPNMIDPQSYSLEQMFTPVPTELVNEVSFWGFDLPGDSGFGFSGQIRLLYTDGSFSFMNVNGPANVWTKLDFTSILDPGKLLEGILLLGGGPPDFAFHELLDDFVVDVELPGACFEEGFDGYALGSAVAGQGGWEAWDNELPAFGQALITGAQALSGTQALEVDGDDDVVQRFAGFTSGRHTIRTHQYVPSSFAGDTWFILLNEYEPDGAKNWSTQIALDSTAGEVRDVDTLDTLPAVFDRWVPIRVEIDLDADSQSVFYDNQLLVTKSWTEGATGGGALNIAAVDLWGNASSPVYYDEVALCPDDVQNVTQGTTHPTIQTAIDAAVNGDVIEAQPRTYYERIDTLGKSITVRTAGSPLPGNGGMATIDGGGVGPVVVIGGGSAALEHVIVTGGVTPDQGAGIRVTGGAFATITGCTVTGNQTGFSGGGIHVEGSSADIFRSVIRDNTAIGDGAGVNVIASSVLLDNCVIFGNTADNVGGGVHTFDGSIGFSETMIVNCSLANNSALAGGAARTFGDATTDVANSIAWGNPSPIEPQISGDNGAVTTVSCSDVEGGWTGPGSDNIDADPQFVNQAAGDLHLLDGSPCVNAGCPLSAIAAGAAPPAVDIDGEPRTQQCVIDIGADETPFFYDDCNGNSVSDACEILEGVGLDDGVPETEIGFQSVQTHLWANSYDAGAGSRIGGVAVAVGGSTVMTGDPITVYLWNDPNDDGQPDDAVLLATASGTIQFENGPGDGATPAMFETNLVLPKLVTGTYFVGAETTTSDFPASIDLDDFVPGRSWINSAGGTPGLQASFLVDGQCGVCDGNWLLRPLLADADGDGIPDDCDCRTDFDNDGETGFQDLLSMLAAWGPCPFCRQDLDGDGEVAFDDLLALLAAWGPCAP